MNKKIVLLAALSAFTIINSNAAIQINSEEDLGKTFLTLLEKVKESNPKIIEPICTYIGITQTEIESFKEDYKALGKKMKEVVNPSIFGISKFLGLTAKLNREKKIDNFGALFALKEPFDAIEKCLTA